MLLGGEELLVVLLVARQEIKRYDTTLSKRSNTMLQIFPKAKMQACQSLLHKNWLP